MSKILGSKFYVSHRINQSNDWCICNQYKYLECMTIVEFEGDVVVNVVAALLVPQDRTD